MASTSRQGAVRGIAEAGEGAFGANEHELCALCVRHVGVVAPRVTHRVVVCCQGKAEIGAATDDDLAVNYEIDSRLVDDGSSADDSLADSSASDQDLDSDIDEVVPTEPLSAGPGAGRGSGSSDGSASDDDDVGASVTVQTMPFLLDPPKSAQKMAQLVKRCVCACVVVYHGVLSGSRRVICGPAAMVVRRQ